MTAFLGFLLALRGRRGHGQPELRPVPGQGGAAVARGEGPGVGVEAGDAPAAGRGPLVS